MIRNPQKYRIILRPLYDIKPKTFQSWVLRMPQARIVGFGPLPLREVVAVKIAP